MNLDNNTFLEWTHNIHAKAATKNSHRELKKVPKRAKLFSSGLRK
ncbi:hypothetical protein Calab_2234 [Caldithrix abyssi DSM 13497]|uniref:Uncharacterized protein n=1 Tax=Caldithrix abyssi DSM 13497 TaxID=880073 RepID=H1XWK6_CALAY|nr:hypothetical protein Cabys_1017 [Caldithrix abyssi DSM 13497]EHO41844.1 hypothetical protein Calab_2234 [Caldithrix abyssi DSM 13497]